MRTVLKENIPPFYTDGQSVLSSQLTTASNILKKFKNSSPLNAWVNFVNNNTKAITGVPVLLEANISDSKVNEGLNSDFLALRENVTSLYSKASEDIKKSACPSKVIASLNAYTDSVVKNFSTDATNLRNYAVRDLKDRQNLLKKNSESFNNIISTCNGKSNVTASRTCILDAVKNSFSSQNSNVNKFAVVLASKNWTSCD